MKPHFSLVVLGARGAGGGHLIKRLFSDPSGQRFRAQGNILAIDRFDHERSPVLNNSGLYQAELSKSLYMAALLEGHGEYPQVHAAVTKQFRSRQGWADQCIGKRTTEDLLSYQIGSARLAGPPQIGGQPDERIFTVEVMPGDGKPSYLVTTKNIFLGTGSTANRLNLSTIAITGGDAANVRMQSSEEFYWRPDHAKSHLIVGTGIIALEAASLLGLFQKRVKLLQKPDTTVLPMVDKAAVEYVLRHMRKKDIRFVGGGITEINKEPGEQMRIRIQKPSKAGVERFTEVRADEILAAIGRTPATQDLGLEHIGLTTAINCERRGLFVDALFQVLDGEENSVPGLFAIGDLPVRRRWEIATVLDVGVAAGVESPKYEWQNLTLKQISVARRHADLVYDRLTKRIQGQVYREDLSTRVIFTDPIIAYFGPQNDEMKNEEVFSVEINLAHKITLVPNAHGFLKIFFKKTSGDIVSAVGVGTFAIELVEYVNICRQKGVRANTGEEMPLSSPSAFSPLYDLFSEARQRWESLNS